MPLPHQKLPGEDISLIASCSTELPQKLPKCLLSAGDLTLRPHHAWRLGAAENMPLPVQKLPAEDIILTSQAAFCRRRTC